MPARLAYARAVAIGQEARYRFGPSPRATLHLLVAAAVSAAKSTYLPDVRQRVVLAVTRDRAAGRSSDARATNLLAIGRREASTTLADAAGNGRNRGISAWCSRANQHTFHAREPSAPSENASMPSLCDDHPLTRICAKSEVGSVHACITGKLWYVQAFVRWSSLLHHDARVAPSDYNLSYRHRCSLAPVARWPRATVETTPSGTASGDLTWARLGPTVRHSVDRGHAVPLHTTDC